MLYTLPTRRQPVPDQLRFAKNLLTSDNVEVPHPDSTRQRRIEQLVQVLPIYKNDIFPYFLAFHDSASVSYTHLTLPTN